MLKKYEINKKLENLNGTLGGNMMPLEYRKYWEGYRRAMCEVIGTKSEDYPFYWE